eukprot:214574-Amphidinium_carterae.1
MISVCKLIQKGTEKIWTTQAKATVIVEQRFVIQAKRQTTEDKPSTARLSRCDGGCAGRRSYQHLEPCHAGEEAHPTQPVPHPCDLDHRGAQRHGCRQSHRSGQ